VIRKLAALNERDASVGELEKSVEHLSRRERG
jgi:hypothetical protein